MRRPGPVVLLHGAASSVSTWDGLRAQLDTAGVASHALPLLGHADQPRRDTYGLDDFRDHALTQIDALGLERVRLAGHSLGAFTALLIAQERPHLVERLLLEEPPAPRRRHDDAPPFTAASHLRMWALSPLARCRMDPRALRQVMRDLHKPMPGWWHALRRVAAPTLVVAGGSRSHVDQQRLRELARALPDASLATVKAGHRVHTKAFDAFSSVAMPFLTLSP